MSLSLVHSTRRTRWLSVALAAFFVVSCNTPEPTAVTTPGTRPHASHVAAGKEIRISQVYGGGGNSGATYTHDFIELYNAGHTAISITGWSVQYASSAGTTWAVTALSGTMLPGSYYLVQQAAGAGGTTPLPTPDATGSIAMSGTSGKVALVNTTTALSGACPAATSYMDLVGYGSAATCFEGSGPTTTLSNTTAAIRLANGATDTDNNAADFAVGAPNPRNSSTSNRPAVSFTTPAANATDVALNANIAVTFDRPVTVTGDWFTISCATSSAHTATVTGGPTSFTIDPDADFVGGESCTVTIVAAQVADQANTSETMSADHSWSFTTVSPPQAGVVISQVYGGGGNSGATLTHDFIELYNAGSTPVSITGWSVQYASSAGTTWQVTALSGTMQPGSYYLVQEGQGAGGTTPLPTPDASGAIAMSATAGKVALVSSSTALSGSCPAATSYVDLVGYGSTANCFEGSAPTPAPSNTNAVLRKGNGATDSNDNAADFVAGTPNPRNSAFTAAPVVASTVPAGGAADVALDASISVTFNKPVTVTGNWYTISCTTSSTHAATVTGGPTTYTIDPTADFVGNESCTVTIVGAQVADQGNASNVMAANFVFSFTTEAGNVCLLPFTPVYSIQGNGAATPLAGQTVSTQGVVVGDFEGAQPALRGFYLQDLTGDGDASTSDGIFVFNGGPDNVSVGDVVRVTGRAEEFQDQTQIGGSVSVVACGSGSSVSPIDVTLPFASSTFAERYEGMLVRLPQTLYVTEHFQLGRFGQVLMSSGGRLAQPTNVVAPGAPALALQAQNDLNQIIIDDARQDQNSDPILFGRGGMPLSASNTLRGGDAATGIVGVLTYTWAGNAASGNAYRVRPVGALGGGVPNFVPANQRPVAPASVGGTFKVGVMNLLNYFNTFGTTSCNNGVGGPTTSCRGAENSTEFTRQSAKTVAAILAMNVDVLGVVEIENDGYGAASAIAELVNQVNAAAGAGTYAFIDVDAATGQANALGTDAIKVGILYKPTTATPIGATAALNSVAFVNGGDAFPRNRPSLAQAFRDNNNGRVVVNVNHFKSKGSACATPDAGDGQGACNVVRTNAANALATWLASDPTGLRDTDVLILGDLNAYAKEDPVAALQSAGYTNLISSRLGQGAYSYAFDGQWGYLDHALATSSLNAQVTGVTEYHINADEPNVLDYNTNFKSAGQLASLYSPDQYRVADHDPIIVGLNLTPTPIYNFRSFLAPVANAPVQNQVNAGQAIPVKFDLGGYFGTNIFDPGYPSSRSVSCTTGAPLSPATPLVLSGTGGLTYSSGVDKYQFVWSTESQWAGTCRELLLGLRDGTTQTAVFSFK